MHKRIFLAVLFVGLLGATSSTLGKLDPHLIAWWAFDEGSGTTAHDSSGHGYDGTFLSSPAWTSGVMGGALDFDGDQDEITLPAKLPIGSSSCTFAAWIKVPLVGTKGLDSGERVGILLGNYNDSPNTNWELHAAGEMRMWWNGGEVDARGTTNLRDDTWHHVAWVRDKAAKGFFLYIDGRLETRTATVGTDITFNTNHRIGGDNRGSPPNFHGLADDLQLYSRAMSQEEIVAIMAGPMDHSVATSPVPSDKSVDVPRDTALSWTPGPYAATHDVYIGTVFADVNTASRTDPRGVLASQGQDVDLYVPPVILQYGQVYYWRIDEVNAAPDTAIFKGKVWSFTVEPEAYPLPSASVKAVASGSAGEAEGPSKTVDKSGLDNADLHSSRKADMWLSNTVTAGGSAWIQYEFDDVYVLHQMQVWNHNSELESVVGLGIKEAMVESSIDGSTWVVLGGVHEFARASGQAAHPANTTVEFDGQAARYVRITAVSNWGGILPQYGLSEVRFLYVPMRARQPEPVSGAADVDPRTPLTWRTGRGAVQHDVYLAADEQAVVDGTALAGTESACRHEAALDLDTTYYWKVNEVNVAADPSVWEGKVWSFSTKEYLIVEDFESYTDVEGGRIYQTWIDGWENKTGSQVGYLEAPFSETAKIHGGRQSMPLTYANVSPVTVSETTRSFAAPQDWRAHGIRTLVLYFRGEVGNTGRLYLKINSVKLLYAGNAADTEEAIWRPWIVDLSTMGAGLSSVKTLTIGVEGAGAKGILYFDDIRLYPAATDLLVPVEPSPAGLLHGWAFDEGSGTSARDVGSLANHGTIKGNPQWVAGMTGTALTFDGDGDEITLPSKLTIGSSSNTLAAWVKIPLVGTGGLGATTRVGILLGNYNDTPNCNWEFHSAGQTRQFWNNGEVDSRGTTDLRDDTWHHVAWVRDKAANACYTYIDGRLEATATKAGTDVTFTTNHRIGADNRISGVLFFHGAMDDLRVYGAALSQGEVAWLAGARTPIDPRF